MKTLGIAVQYPPISLCTGECSQSKSCLSIDWRVIDNAAMIAWASMDRFVRGDVDPYDINVKPKWDLGELHAPSE
jgi:tRNA A37 threonylcarbamoyltransferase TsaD